MESSPVARGPLAGRTAGRDRALPRLAASRGRRPGHHPGRGQHAAGGGQRCPRSLGCEVWLKVEGANPTGSFKDRGMTVAISVAAGQEPRRWSVRRPATPPRRPPRTPRGPGCRRSCCCPPAGSRPGSWPRRSFTAPRWCRSRATSTTAWIWPGAGARVPVALVNSVNPARIEGQKTAAFEIVDELGDAPDLHVLPVGNGGNITAYWRGYIEYARAGRATRKPRMWGFQAAGAAPLVLGHPVNPETVATAIRIGNPASHNLAVAAREESGGLFEAVSDEQILAAQAFLAAVRASSWSRRRQQELLDCWPSTSGERSKRATDRHHRHRPRTKGHRHGVVAAGPVRPRSYQPRCRRGRRAACALSPEAGLRREPDPGTAVTIDVPATSANLGPGFDCFGLALDWQEQVEVEVSTRASAEVTGEGAGSVPRMRRT